MCDISCQRWSGGGLLGLWWATAAACLREWSGVQKPRRVQTIQRYQIRVVVVCSPCVHGITPQAHCSTPVSLHDILISKWIPWLWNIFTTLFICSIFLFLYFNTYIHKMKVTIIYPYNVLAFCGEVHIQASCAALQMGVAASVAQTHKNTNDSETNVCFFLTRQMKTLYFQLWRREA